MPTTSPCVDVEVGRLEQRRGVRGPARAAPASSVRSIVRPAVRRDRFQLVQLAADHLGDQLAARQVVDEILADELPVAQNGDAVRDLVDLVEEVADEQHGDAGIAEVADDGEQLLDFAAVQTRGRLVEDQHLGVEHHRAADRDQLLDRDGVAGEDRAGVDLQSEALEVARGAPVGGLPVDAAARGAARARASRSRRRRGWRRGSPPGRPWRCPASCASAVLPKTRGSPATAIDPPSIG